MKSRESKIIIEIYKNGLGKSINEFFDSNEQSYRSPLISSRRGRSGRSLKQPFWKRRMEKKRSKLDYEIQQQKLAQAKHQTKSSKDIDSEKLKQSRAKTEVDSLRPRQQQLMDAEALNQAKLKTRELEQTLRIKDLNDQQRRRIEREKFALDLKIAKDKQAREQAAQYDRSSYEQARTREMDEKAKRQRQLRKREKDDRLYTKQQRQQQQQRQEQKTREQAEKEKIGKIVKLSGGDQYKYTGTMWIEIDPVTGDQKGPVPNKTYQNYLNREHSKLGQIKTQQRTPSG